MSKFNFNVYLSFGLFVGIIFGWLMVFGQTSNDIYTLASNVVLGITIMSILIPVLTLVMRTLTATTANQEQQPKSESLLLQSLALGSVAFIFPLALFLVAVLLILMIAKGIDGGELRNMIYQTINWQILLVGLLATILSFYGSAIAIEIRTTK